MCRFSSGLRPFFCTYGQCKHFQSCSGLFEGEGEECTKTGALRCKEREIGLRFRIWGDEVLLDEADDGG